MRALFVEPFDGGSHRRFLRVLCAGLRDSYGVECTVLAMPGRHWKWRMRGAVPWLADNHAGVLEQRYDLVFASSYLALAELIGLFPHLGGAARVLYFHENQLAYPDRADRAGFERDTHFGFTQMVSALAATCCLFNSDYNRRSFLDAGADLLARMPDARLPGWRGQVEERSAVLGVPMQFPATSVLAETPLDQRAEGPMLLWNHRWEHDKNPEAFFSTLTNLAGEGLAFRVTVCGEQFREVPESMRVARSALAGRLRHFGFEPDRRAYEALLADSHLVVSTANHEFFGLSVMEAVWCGARPHVPDRLAYQELFPPEYRYQDLESSLRDLCLDWTRQGGTLRADRRHLIEGYAADQMIPRFFELFEDLVARTP